MTDPLPIAWGAMRRRQFLKNGSRAMLASCVLAFGGRPAGAAIARPRLAAGRPAHGGPPRLRLFLAGDLMTGRGIDQVLPHSVDPALHEPYVLDARTYVQLAEERNGPIPREVPYRYVWGDALDELDRADPHARIVNLETAVTTRDEWWRDKAIHYRMHPRNVELLTAAGVDVAVLGNNHVLDWGRRGLRETLAVLGRAGLHAPGAGADHAAAAAPAALQTGAGRLLVFSYGSPTAGVPPAWAAGDARPGVNLLPRLGTVGAERIACDVEVHRSPGDRVVVSLHWGGNWGYAVPAEQRELAHTLIDAGAADVVHGHSSHHPKGIEVYRGRPILYGAGDFLNDYEGIRGHQEVRPDLTLMYWLELDEDGALASLEMTPLRIRRFRLQHAAREEAEWLAGRLDRESRVFGARVDPTGQRRLRLRWE